MAGPQNWRVRLDYWSVLHRQPFMTEVTVTLPSQPLLSRSLSRACRTKIEYVEGCRPLVPSRWSRLPQSGSKKPVFQSSITQSLVKWAFTSDSITTYLPLQQHLCCSETCDKFASWAANSYTEELSTFQCLSWYIFLVQVTPEC